MLKTLLVVTVSLVASNAFADGRWHVGVRHPARPIAYQPYVPPTPPMPQRNGHYEQRQTQQWVAGDSYQVWVPGTCNRNCRRRSGWCDPGHYETRQGPGRYQQVTQWVWVPDYAPLPGQPGHQPPQYSEPIYTRPPLPPAPRYGLAVPQASEFDDDEQDDDFDPGVRIDVEARLN